VIEFESFGKISRLFRDCTITEKIDGTNAAVGIKFGSREEGLTDSEYVLPLDEPNAKIVDRGGFEINGMHNVAVVYAQSRKRLITPDDDNYGFARWVWANAEVLVETLGPGLHFGEWWGSGVQRGYDLPKGQKRFSLFNTARWNREDFRIDGQCNYIPPELDVVPVLYQGAFSTEIVHWAKAFLREKGSLASPGFMRPEGVVVYHAAARTLFKSTLENDEVPKAVAAGKADLGVAA
jgi:hypothetical protein